MREIGKAMLGVATEQSRGERFEVRKSQERIQFDVVAKPPVRSWDQSIRSRVPDNGLAQGL